MATITLLDKKGLLDTTAEIIQTEGSIAEFIVSRYYDNDINFTVMDGDDDITQNVDALLAGYGNYVVIEAPLGGFEIIANYMAFQAAVNLLAPLPKLPKNIGAPQESPNNSLSTRSNQARPLQRIPDIKGTVRAIPDVVMPQYSRYIENEQVEYGYYCVGRKQLQIENIKDGDTPLTLIRGAGAGIYYPNKNPSTDTPDVVIGEEFTEPVYIPYRINDVNGVRLPLHSQAIEASSVTVADYAETIISGSTTTIILRWGIDYSALFASRFAVDDYILLSNFIYTADTTTQHKIKSITYSTDSDPSRPYIVTLDTTRFDTLADGTYITGITYFVSVSKLLMPYNEWYYMTRDECDSVLVNVVADNGVQFATIVYDIEIEGVDDTGEPDGVITTDTVTLVGRGDKITAASTEVALPARKKFRVRVVNDESSANASVVNLREIFGLKETDAADFGNVTTIQTKTIANPTATSIKERQLNCIATEMLYEYETGTGFAGSLSANASAIQSFITDAVDPLFGRLAITDIDAEALLDLDSEINTYFADTRYSEFNYTVDSTNLTFQDYAKMLFNTINCIPYQADGLVSAIFEKPQTTPTMLFTHRSKIPNTETYSRNFNRSQLSDGVEVKYKDSTTNQYETIYIPVDQSATNPKKFELPGISYSDVAFVRAAREYKKITLMKSTLNFSSTIEGRLVKPNDLIAVVKGTRVKTQDGEITDYDSVTGEVGLSQPVTFTPGDDHYIVFKYPASSVPALCVAGADEYHVNILPIISTGIATYDDDVNRRTEFTFWNEARALSELWLAQEIDISDKWEVKIKAINYNENYYADDFYSTSDFSSGFDSGFS